MNPETLKYIKQELRKFHKVVSLVTEYWAHYAYLEMMCVLLQNIAHDSSDCVNYSHEDTVKELYQVKDMLYAISKYHDVHFTKWIFEEVDCIITGNALADEFPYEDEQALTDVEDQKLRAHYKK